MATGISGTIIASASTYIVARISYSETYDVSSNTSSITATLAYRRTNAYSGVTQSTGAFYVTINGTECLVLNGLFTIPANNNDWQTVGSATVSGISHNADGSKKISIGGSHTGSISPYYLNFTTSETVTLTSIPRASKPKASKSSLVLDGTDSVVISTNRASSSFTHTITVAIDGFSHVENNVGESYTFKPTPAYWMPYMTSAEMTATVTCSTYSGSTQIGSDQTCTFKIKVDQSQYAPVITSVTLSDTNTATAAVEADNTFINGVSNLRAVVVLGVTDSNYVSLASAVINADQQEITEYALSGTTATITFTCEEIEAAHLSIEVTDHRGAKVSQTINLSIIPYQPLSIRSVSSIRANSSGDPSETGAYLSYEITVTAFEGTFGGQHNYLNLKYKYRKAGTEASYTTGENIAAHTSSRDGVVTNYTFTGMTGEEFDASYQYDLVFMISDMFSSAEYVLIVHEGLPVFAWGRTHFDVYGEHHVHDRSDPWNYLTYGISSEDEKTSVLLSAYGHITSSGEKAVIYIPMLMLPVNPKILSLQCSLRTVAGGYLGTSTGTGNVELSSEIDTANGAVSVIREQGVLRIVLYRSGGYGITNNTPFSGEVTITYTVEE